MDWKRAMEAERAALKRIAVLLLALADLAEIAGNRPPAIRGTVLWILLPAEAVARSLLIGAPVSIPLRRAGNSRADAMRLAQDFLGLAREMNRRALAFAVLDDDSGQDEPARFAVQRAPRSGGLLNFMNVLPSALDTLRRADLPDT
jgi:hypothetical protein